MEFDSCCKCDDTPPTLPPHSNMRQQSKTITHHSPAKPSTTHSSIATKSSRRKRRKSATASSWRTFGIMARISSLMQHQHFRAKQRPLDLLSWCGSSFLEFGSSVLELGSSVSGSPCSNPRPPIFNMIIRRDDAASTRHLLPSRCERSGGVMAAGHA